MASVGLTNTHPCLIDHLVPLGLKPQISRVNVGHRYLRAWAKVRTLNRLGRGKTVNRPLKAVNVVPKLVLGSPRFAAFGAARVNVGLWGIRSKSKQLSALAAVNVHDLSVSSGMGRKQRRSNRPKQAPPSDKPLKPMSPEKLARVKAHWDRLLRAKGMGVLPIDLRQ